MQMRLNKLKGFTLIELLVALAILGILTVVGVPSYNKFVQHGEFSEAYNGLYNTYRYGRAEAIKTSSKMKFQSFGTPDTVEYIIYPFEPGKGYSDRIAVTPVIDKSKIQIIGDSRVISGNGSIPEKVAFSVLDRRNGRLKYLCILKNGQSYQSEVSCPW